MLTSTLKQRLVRTSAGIAAVALMVGPSVIGGTPAGADPKQFAALVGVGSDTTQDVTNAFAGFNNTFNYTPLQSSAGSGLRQVVSWDAIVAGSDCITTKGGTAAAGPTFLRPNGSTNGRRALSRAIDSGTFPASTALCGGPKAMAGQVDFARSSAGPSGTGSDLVYIPFGRDGLSFAYYRSTGTTVNNFTAAQLVTFFSTAGPHFADPPTNSIEVVPCGIQTGSGTYAAWNTALGITATQEDGATATCNNASGSLVRLQENDGNGLKAKGDLAALAGKQVIVAFATGNFISQTNGRAVNAIPTGVLLGKIGTNDPYTPFPASGPPTPPIAPGAAFYAGAFGRDVYNVLSSIRVDGAGSNDFKTMFVGSGSTMCSSAASTISGLFGFLAPVLPCGATTLRGPLVANS